MLVFSLVTDLRASLPSNNFSRSFANNDIDYTIPSGPRYELHTRSQLARRGLTRLDNGGTRRRECAHFFIRIYSTVRAARYRWSYVTVPSTVRLGFRKCVVRSMSQIGQQGGACYPGSQLQVAGV